MLVPIYSARPGQRVMFYVDQQVTVSLMENISQYDFIYMATHGGVDFLGNVEIMTDEIVNYTKLVSFWNQLKTGATGGIPAPPSHYHPCSCDSMI